MLSPSLAFAATLSLSPASGTLNTGCTYSFDILMDTGGINTDGTDAVLKYTTSQFTVTSITKGTLYPDYPASDFSNGVISISGLASPGQGVSVGGKFATINVTIPAGASAGPAPIVFDFTPGATNDSNVVQSTAVVDKLSSVVNGNYTIAQGGNCALTTAPVVVQQPVATDSGIPGKGGLQVSPIPTKTLGDTADISPTEVFSILGGFFTILGVSGLAIFRK